MAKLTTTITADDKASAVINKAATNAKDAAAKIAGGDKQISEATKTAARAKQEQLSLSQKMKFALAKEAAAGNKLKSSLVTQKEALAKMERKLRASIKAGDAESAALAKQTVALRKNAAAIQKKIDKEEASQISMKGMAKGIAAVTVAAAAAAAGAFLLTKRIAEQGDEMIKGAKRLDMTLEQYQKLDFAMKISGTSIDKQKGALRKFARTARDATVGVKASADAFATLGIKVKNNDGTFKGSQDLLMEVSNAYKSMPDGIDKSAVAMDLFGKSGADMTQFLNLGAEGIAALGVEAAELGGVMSEKAARGSEEFVDAMTRMETVAGSVTRGMGETMQTPLTRMMNQIAETIKDLKLAYRPIFQDMVTFVSEAAQLVVPTLGFIAKGFVGLATTASLAWKGLLLVLNTSISGWVQTFNVLIDQLNRIPGVDISPLADNFKDTAEDIAKDMGDVVEASAKTMEGIDKIGDALLGNAEIRVNVSKPAIDEENNSLRVQNALLKEQEQFNKEQREKREEEVDDFVSNRARMREANLKLQEGMIRMWEKNEETAKETLKSEQKQAAATGNAIGTSLGAAFAAGETAMEGMKNVFKVVAQQIIETVKMQVIEIIMAHAGGAAAGAAESQASIPYIGPVLAVAAASAMFALVSGYVSKMAQGGIVPGIGNSDTVPALLTPGEIVLPKALSELLLETVGRRGGSGTGFAQGGVVGNGGAGVIVNFNEAAIMPRTPGELDRFLNDKLIPSLQRLRRKGVAI